MSEITTRFWILLLLNALHFAEGNTRHQPKPNLIYSLIFIFLPGNFNSNYMGLCREYEQVLAEYELASVNLNLHSYYTSTKETWPKPMQIRTYACVSYYQQVSSSYVISLRL